MSFGYSTWLYNLQHISNPKLSSDSNLITFHNRIIRKSFDFLQSAANVRLVSKQQWALGISTLFNFLLHLNRRTVNSSRVVIFNLRKQLRNFWRNNLLTHPFLRLWLNTFPPRYRRLIFLCSARRSLLGKSGTTLLTLYHYLSAYYRCNLC